MEKGNESHATERGNIVPHGGVKDATLAELQNHGHGLVVAGALVRRVGVRGSEDGHVLAGSAQGIVEFVGGVHPDVREPAQDGVVGSARGDLEGKPIAVIAGVTWRGIADEFVLVEVPVRPSLLGPVAPSTDPGHEVIRRPVGKAVVCGVNDDETAAVADELLELRAQILRPVRAVVVHDDGLKFAKLRIELAEIAVVRGRRKDSDLKEARLFQNLAKNRRGEFPIVVGASAFAIEQKDANGWVLRCRGDGQQCRGKRGEKGQCLHQRFLPRCFQGYSLEPLSSAGSI